LADAKHLWAREEKKKAIDRLKDAVAFLDLRDKPLGKGIENLSDENFTRLIDVLRQHARPGLVLPGKKEELLGLYAEHPSALEACFKEMFDALGVVKELEAPVYRTLAFYLYTRGPQTPETLREVEGYYQRGLDRNPNDYKQWLGLAYANARMAEIQQGDHDRHAIAAVTYFLKASQPPCRPRNTLQFLYQLFSIFFRVTDGSLVTDDLRKQLLDLPPGTLADIIPQLTDQIAHPNQRIRDVVHDILVTFGHDHFELLFYPLKLYQASDHAEKSALALDLLNRMSAEHRECRRDADLFVDGLLRAAISWFEKWMLDLDAASRAHHDGQLDRANEILVRLFSRYDHPQCELDQHFIKLNRDLVDRCRELFRDRARSAPCQMWNGFRELFARLTDRVNRFELILLPKVSEELATKRGFAITVPGTYRVGRPLQLLDRIEPALEVLATQQHPRCVYMVSKDNAKMKFLLKGNEDIRVDERLMQFFNLINSLMQASRPTREAGAQIVKYSIIPLAPNAGLIAWVTGADTLHQMICEQRQRLGIPQRKEFDELIEITHEHALDTMASIQRLECFRVIKAKCPATEIRDIFWRRAINASAWMDQSTAFTVTTALMSIVGYAIGLGDRHPSNIMVQRETGRVIHIDFGDSFEKARSRRNFPERVPFRLTRMIENALDSGTVEGLFRRSCEDVMRVLREGRASLTALLQIFIHEPLEEPGGHEKAKSQVTQVERVAEKLSGRDRELAAWQENTGDLPIKAHVDALIAEAREPANYVRHWSGWCPFW
jgi:phosphatidylinositol kinase/protein kinase (PI-3  family)